MIPPAPAPNSLPPATLLDEPAFRRALLRATIWPAVSLLGMVAALLALTLFVLRPAGWVEYTDGVLAQPGTLATLRNTLLSALLLVSVVGVPLLFATCRRLMRKLGDAYHGALTATAAQRDELRVTLGSIGDAVLATDGTGAIAFLNPVAERLTGWSDAEARGRTVTEVLPLFHEQTGLPAENPVLRVLRERAIVDLANRTVLRRRDGSEVPIEDSAAPILNDEGAVRGVILVFHDVSEKRSRERALRRAEARSRTIFNQQFQFIAILSPTGEVLDVNDLPLRTGGVTREEVLGKKFWDTTWWRSLPEMRAAWPSRIAEAAGTDRPLLSEDRYNDAAGEARWADCALTAVRDEAGGVEFIIVQASDITERKRTEEQVRRNQDIFFNLVQQAPFGVYVIDAQFRLYQVNSGAQAVFSNVRPLIGRDFDEALRIIWPEPFVSEALGHFRHTLATGEAYLAPSITGPRRDSGVVESYEWQLHRVVLPDGQFGVVCYFYDSTNLRSAEAAVRENQQRFATLVSAVPNVVWSARADGSISYANAFWYEYTGASEDETLGFAWTNFVHPDDLPGTLARWQQSLSSGEEVNVEYRLRRRDGVYRWYYARGVALRDENGAVANWLGTLTDVHEARTHTELLRESEARFRALADDSPIFIWMADENTNVTYANRTHLEFLGCRDLNEFLGRAWERVIHPDDLERIRRAYHAAAANQQAFTFEIRYLEAATQSYRWHFVKGVPRSVEGRFAGFMGTSVDIHDRKKVEEALRAGEAKYRALFESMDEGFCVIEVLFDEQGRSVDYRFLEYNPAFEKHTGIIGARGKTIREIAPGHEAHWFDIYGAVAKTGEPIRFENRAEQLGRWFDVFAFRIETAAPNQVAVLFNDITARKRTEEALREAKEQAEAASRAKDNFLATLSHELRNPLAPVLMSASALVEDERLPAEVRADLAMIRRNITLEARLIDDLLDLTRIARGKIPVRKELCDVHSLLGLAVEIVRDEAQAKPVALHLDLTARRTGLRGDPARLQQVFWNVLRNAIKFTPAGGHVRVRTADDEAAGRIRIEISDTGVGLAPEVRDTIFQPFEQAGRENDHRFGGLGLGLTIARAIVDLHGGTIRAESAGVDKGATFFVELPGAGAPPSGIIALPSTPGGAPQAAPVRGGKLRLLVVEDHEPTLTVLSRLLTREGHEITTAGSVATALAAAESSEYDFVISDLGLPDGTGLELMTTLRVTRPWLSGIAISGYGMDDDMRRSREAGFAVHLIKPIDFEQLRRALREATAHLSRPAGAE